jgi:integrase
VNAVAAIAVRLVDPVGVRALVQAGRAENTVRAYRAAWREFSWFCELSGVRSMPAAPSAVVDYLTWLVCRVKPSTMQVKLAAVSFAHRAARQPDPTHDEDVQVLMAGIRRRLGTAPQKKAPATFEDVTRMVETLEGDLRGKRDRALLLLGFAGAFRRSELVELDVADVRFNSQTMTITVRHSKTDQDGAGMKKVIPYLDGALNPAAALRDWLTGADIASGPLFRGVDRWGVVGSRRLNGRTVARIVKASALAAGLEPHQFAGHSLRSGFITSAAMRGAPEWQIQEISGHRSERVLRGYIRDAGLGGQAAVRAAFGKLEAA